MTTKQPITKEPYYTSERWNSIQIGVHISCDGRGMSKDDIQRCLNRLAKAAKGHSSTRKTSAVCGELEAVEQGKFYGY